MTPIKELLWQCLPLTADQCESRDDRIQYRSAQMKECRDQSVQTKAFDDMNFNVQNGNQWFEPPNVIMPYSFKRRIKMEIRTRHWATDVVKAHATAANFL